MTDDIIKEAQEWMQESADRNSANRREMSADWKFAVNQEQWPDQLKRQREGDPHSPRPCLVVNATMHHCRQVINEMRLNRPEPRVLPVDDKADKRTAEIIMGMMRHINHVSDADVAYDAAAEHQVISGEGYWEIGTKLLYPLTNEQEINVYPIFDPTTVDMDVRDDPCGSDAPRCLISHMMPRHMFQRKYPDVDVPKSWKEGEKFGWYSKHEIRVGRYWNVSSAVQKMVIAESPEGEMRVVPETEYAAAREDFYREWTYHRDYAAETQRVTCYVLAGKEVIETIDWPGIYIPVARVVGEEYVVDGRRITHGMVRRAADPQRIKNYTFSAYVEQVSLAPKAPFTAPVKAIEGHENLWQMANRLPLSVLPWNHVDDAGNPIPEPRRQPGPEVAAGWAQGVQMADQALAETTGKFDPSTGESVDQMSGIALQSWQVRGDIGTYHYLDNMAKAIRHTARVMVDLMPKVYDTPRIARILGEDGEPDMVNLYPGMGQAYAEEQQGEGYEKFYDLSIGRYDVRAAAGPSFTTRRQEAAERLKEYLSANPELWNVIGDLVFRVSDHPMADEMADRVARMIPPELMGEESEQNVRQKLAQAMQQIQQQEQVIGELLQRADDTDIKRMKAGADISKAETDRLETEAKIDEIYAKIADMAANREEENRRIAREAVTYALQITQGDAAA